MRKYLRVLLKKETLCCRVLHDTGFQHNADTKETITVLDLTIFFIFKHEVSNIFVYFGYNMDF